MLFQKAKIENGEIKITESISIDQDKLTDDCWSIQISGLSACKNCEALNTDDCGGLRIRKTLIEKE